MTSHKIALVIPDCSRAIHENRRSLEEHLRSEVYHSPSGDGLNLLHCLLFFPANSQLAVKLQSPFRFEWLWHHFDHHW